MAAPARHLERLLNHARGGGREGVSFQFRGGGPGRVGDVAGGTQFAAGHFAQIVENHEVVLGLALGIQVDALEAQQSR